MKISVDGGALDPKNNQRFGTAVFSENLVKAVKLYDKKNHYQIYTFKNLKPKLFWMKGRVSLEEYLNKKDIFLALNQAVPIFASGKIISFCHGLSYRLFPKYYSEKDLVRLNGQFKEMVKRSDKIIVSSKKVKDELVSMYRYIQKKIFVLPFGIPFDMAFSARQLGAKKTSPYFLFVGMDHRIKNIKFIRDAFNRLGKSRTNFKLKIATKNVSREKLKKLYRGATALLTASYYESFNLPVLEALSQGCPVIGLKSAIIPELSPFVNVASDKKQFISLMKKAERLPTVDRKKLLKTFSWKNYVKNLVRLYQ